MSENPVTSSEAPVADGASMPAPSAVQAEAKPARRTARRRTAAKEPAAQAEGGEQGVPSDEETPRRRARKADAADEKPARKRAVKRAKAEEKADAPSTEAASVPAQDSEREPKIPAFARNIPGYAEAVAAKAKEAAEAKPARRGAKSASPAEGQAAAGGEDSADEKPARSRRRSKPAEGQSDSVRDAADSSSDEASSHDARHDGDEEAPRARRRARRAAEADGDKAKHAEQGTAKEEEPSSKKSSRKKSDKRKPDSDAQSQQRAPKGGKGQKSDRSGQNGRQNDRQNDHGKQRQRRQHQERREVKPSVSREDLAALKVAELRTKAAELEIAFVGLKKAELVEAVYAASMKAEGFIEVEGILDIMPDGYGFARTSGYLPGENDAYVGLSMIRRNGLRKGDLVKGQLRPKRENEKFAAMQTLISVNGIPVEELGNRVRFSDLTPVFPDDRMVMEHGKNTITARVIDLTAPIGKGQRGLIVSPPKAGKTTILKDIAAAITANNPEVHLMCLLVDERPEEVTDMQRSIRGEVISSTFDMPCENHIAVAEMVIERAKRLVECGEDVVILLDSLTRLARAYNLAQPASGRILSGGVDSTALYPPKRFLGAARNIEGGGSLTILASALIETGSKMDEVIFEEFKGTGNMELKLDRSLADRRIFPAIDPVQSGTRKEDLLLDPQEAPLIWAVRRILSNMNSTERAMDMLIKSLKQTETNEEFLIRTAKKAQGHRGEEGFGL